MYLGVCFLGSNFFGTLWVSWTSWKSISFTRLRKFSFIMFSNKFSISCCCSSPSGTPMIRMLECLKMSCRSLSFSLFWILISSFCSGWMFLSSFWSKSLIWVLVSFPSLLIPPYIFFFISLCIAFISSFILQLSSINSVSIWLPVFWTLPSDRLSISLSLTFIFGVLICSLIWPIFLCLSVPVTL